MTVIADALFEMDVPGEGAPARPAKPREVFVTRDGDGKIVTSFGAPIENVASALRAHGWAVYPPGEVPAYREARKGRSRREDAATSAQGARDVAVRAGTQAARLLDAYADAGDHGFTDEEAATHAALTKACYWKRCGELREDHLIEQVIVDGKEVTREGEAGTARIVSRITAAGWATLEAMRPRD